MPLPPFGTPPTPLATSSKPGKVQLAGDLAGTAAAPTIKSSVGLTGNPTSTTQTAGDNSNKIATDAFVTGAIATAVAGSNPAVAVQAATTQASDTSGLTYNNGVSGVGATLTGLANTALTVDGFTFTAVNQRILIKNDTQSPSGAFNGIYFVSQIQTAIVPIILTRALDYDQPSDVNNTGSIPVVNGTTQATTSWILTSAVTTIGTDPLTYTKFTLNPATILTNGLTSSHIFVGNGSNVATDTALSGDATINNSGSLALATVNANTGTFGSATQVATFTVNGKGLTTAAGNTSIQIAESQVTNLATDLAGKQATGNYITALTSDVTASGPGSAAATLVNTTNVQNIINADITSYLPSQTGNSGEYLQTNGTSLLWASAGVPTPTTLQSNVIIPSYSQMIYRQSMKLGSFSIIMGTDTSLIGV